MRKIVFLLFSACGTMSQPGDILRSQYQAKDPYCQPLSDDVWDCYDSGIAYSCENQSGRWTCHVRGYDPR